MKKVLGVIVSLILSIIAVVAIIFLTLNIFKSPKTLPKIAKMANYYEDSYPVILANVKAQVGAEKLQEIVESVVTKERVTNDINEIIDKGNSAKENVGALIKVDLTKAFKEGLDGKYEEDALTNLVSLVGDTYEKSLFPNEEFDIVYKVLNKIPFISIIFIGTLIIYLLICLILLVFAKNGYRIVAVSNFMAGFLLIFPYLFVNLSSLFENFYYTNIYWTAFLKKTINFLFNAFGIAGVVFIVLGIIVVILEKIVKKDK